VDEIPAKAFVKRLARGEVFQNQKIEPAPIIAFLFDHVYFDLF
jgi:hypothetical protein